MDRHAAPLRTLILGGKWYIIAPDGDEPQIPCTAAVVIACKLARGDAARTGALPCLELFSVDEFMAALAGFNVHETAWIYPGDQDIHATTGEHLDGKR